MFIRMTKIYYAVSFAFIHFKINIILKGIYNKGANIDQQENRAME